MFVSEQAHALLSDIGKNKQCSMGDVVDVLLEVKTYEQLPEENKAYKKTWTT